MPRGQINGPSWGKHNYLPFLPATPLSPSRTLEGLFQLTLRPSRALDSPRALLPELQRYKDTVCLARHRGLSALSRTANANLDCAFVKRHLFMLLLKLGGPGPSSLLLVTFSPLLAQHQVHWMGGQCATLTLLLFWHSGATCSALICRHPEKASLSF